MTATMPLLDFASLTAGSRVQHERLVRSREDKNTRNGDPFAALQLGNATGTIAANIWKEMLPQVAGIKAGVVVQVIGEVEVFQGKRQLKLTAPPRIVPMTGVDIEAFLPRVSTPLSELWSQIDGWRAAIASPTLRRAVDLFFADDEFRARFERTPGAPRGHHALLGGLLLHVVEVATIARNAAQTMGGDVDLVTVGALLHDIGKVETYSIGVGGFDYTDGGFLLQHIVLGSLMLDRRIRALPAATFTEAQELELHHFIQSHHGQPEFGAAVRPMTLEAELLHWADQTSANGNNFTDAVADPELFPGDESFSVKKAWRLDRKVWRRTHHWE